VKAELRSMTAVEKHALSQRIWATAEATTEFAEAESVLVYCSLPDEVETAEFIERWIGRKRIIVPLVTGDTLALKEYDPASMHIGAFGILEPSADAPDVAPSEIDVAFIPGVAFDSDGQRLGRGKGFYDRLLPALPCPTVGICYPCQRVDRLPADPWDIPVGSVITIPADKK